MTAPEQRLPTLRLWHEGAPVVIDGWLTTLAVDERVDGASTVTVTMANTPVETPPADGHPGGNWDTQLRGGDAELFGMPGFRLLSRFTVELGTQGADETAPRVASVVFDGYLTGFEHVIAETRVPDSHLTITGIDASCLMNFQTVTREWYGRTDADIARDIFGSYGFAVTDDTVDPTGPVRDGDAATLVQRCTDAEFLLMLARRNGFEVFVAPSGGPVQRGRHPRAGVAGHFRAARTRPGPAELPALALFPHDAASLKELRVSYDSHRPTRQRSWHVDSRSRRIQQADVSEPGYDRLGATTRAAVVAERLGEILAGRPPVEPVDVTSADVPHHAAEVTALARADHRDADWFARGTGVVDGERYPAIVRAGRRVDVTGAGQVLDGPWYVRGVRHRWRGHRDDPPSAEPVDATYEADVELVRNALGAQP